MSFFRGRQTLLGIAATAYVVMLITTHWRLSDAHVWVIAVVFSILMNFTYLIEALSLKSHAKTEAVVAATLIFTSVMGLILSPLLLIAAIFGHGVWDLLKHFGRGVPFLYWYTCSCFLVDTTYSAALLFYYISQENLQ